MDLVWIGAHYETDNEHEYSNNSEWESYRSLQTTTEDIDGHALVLVPHIGARYYLKQSAEQKPIGLFLRGAWFFSIPTVQIDGEQTVERWEYTNGNITSHERYDREQCRLAR